MGGSVIPFWVFSAFKVKVDWNLRKEWGERDQTANWITRLIVSSLQNDKSQNAKNIPKKEGSGWIVHNID